jgi:exonuclease III
MEIGLMFKNKATASEAKSDALSPPAGGGSDKWVTGRSKARWAKMERKRIKPGRLLRIATWNVRSGSTAEARQLIAAEMARLNIDVLAITELRMKGNGKSEIPIPGTDESITCFHSGGDKHEFGVGFFVRRWIKATVASFTPVNERICHLQLYGTIKVNIICAYAPTEVSIDCNKDKFYDDLQLFCDRVPKRDIMIVLGDMNAHLGSNRTGWETVLGKYTRGMVNDNGTRLLSFACNNNLRITNTFFRHRLKHVLTWRSPSGKDKSTIDFVMISNRFASSIVDTRVYRSADCSSDHHLLLSKFKLRLRSVKNISRSVRLDWSVLKQAPMQDEFQLQLSKRFSALHEPSNLSPESLMDQLEIIVKEVGQSVCPKVRKKRKPWISYETLDLVSKRRAAKNTNFDQYLTYNKMVKVSLKKDAKQHWENVAKFVEDNYRENNMKAAFGMIARLSGKRANAVSSIKRNDGIDIDNPKEEMEIWKNHFQQLLNGDASDPTDLNIQAPKVVAAARATPDAEQNHESEITHKEVVDAVNKLKLGKATGGDGIPAEALKFGGLSAIEWVKQLCESARVSKNIPSHWKKGTITPIFKKGDKTSVKNYRGITLLSVVGKIFMRILQDRLRSRRHHLKRENQAAFEEGRGCIDHIFALRQPL